MRFLKVNWLWIVIAVVALILLITIIACAVRASKKKREREEQRRLEEKAERERKEEREEQRRREEREERMARMSQMQAAPAPQYMPQPMPQPQYMPQSTPQSAQPAATGGGSVNETLMQMQAELAALRATQENMRAELTAKELAEIKAEQAAMRAEQNTAKEMTALRNEITFVKRDGQVVANGVSMDKLTELVEMTVEKVLDRRDKPVQAAAANADSVAAQVPPDAVMTTVTTTKIDTTKKPAQGNAQNAQAQAQARPIVRNYVAPMPVDDGRVFDVGGFYTPADPVDLNFVEEDKKD